MIKDIIVCLFFLSMTLVFPLFVSAEEDMGFQETWGKSDVNFNEYEELYIYGIDLREMLIETVDNEGNAEVEGIDESKLEDIANQMYGVFFKHLNPIIPVNQDEEDTKGTKNNKSLVMDLKLAATFVVEGKKPGMQLPDQGNEEPSSTTLFFECRMYDAQSNETMLTLSDTHEISVQDKNSPFYAQSDKEALYGILELWARMVANFLKYGHNGE